MRDVVDFRASFPGINDITHTPKNGSAYSVHQPFYFYVEFFDFLESIERVICKSFCVFEMVLIDYWVSILALN